MTFSKDQLKHILIKLMDVPHQSSLTLEQRLNLIKRIQEAINDYSRD
jgi:hypothetical protein